MLIGREKEIKTLQQAYHSEYSEFVAVYGRRRIGKTFLIREAFNYQFAFQHIPQIKKELGISGILSNVASWRASQTETHAGAQIDLLIDRGDNVVTVCEMKYSKDIFVIDASYAKALESKLSVFRTVSGTRKALHLALITTFGVSHNKYRNLVQNDLTMDCLFG